MQDVIVFKTVILEFLKEDGTFNKELKCVIILNGTPKVETVFY